MIHHWKYIFRKWKTESWMTFDNKCVCWLSLGPLVGLGNTQANLTATSPWALMGCIHKCWGSCWTPQQGHPQSWQSGDVPEDWKRADDTPVFKRARKRTQGTAGKSASLKSLPGERMPYSRGHLCAREGQGDQEYSARLHWREVIFDQPDCLLWWNYLARWGEEQWIVSALTSGGLLRLYLIISS